MPDDSAIAASFDQESAQLDDNTGMLPLLTDDRMLFSRRLKQTGDISDISKAISVENRLVARTPKGTHNLPGRLANLSMPQTPINQSPIEKLNGSGTTTPSLTRGSSTPSSVFSNDSNCSLFDPGDIRIQ